jgi:hypothetical protein
MAGWLLLQAIWPAALPALARLLGAGGSHNHLPSLQRSINTRSGVTGSVDDSLPPPSKTGQWSTLVHACSVVPLILINSHKRCPLIHLPAHASCHDDARTLHRKHGRFASHVHTSTLSIHSSGMMPPLNTRAAARNGTGAIMRRKIGCVASTVEPRVQECSRGLACTPNRHQMNHVPRSPRPGGWAGPWQAPPACAPTPPALLRLGSGACRNPSLQPPPPQLHCALLLHLVPLDPKQATI